MIESTVEKRLCKKVKNELHGLALKFISPGLSGVPDRIVLLPGGRIYFAELKAPGREMRKLQRWVASKIEALGFKVLTINTPEKVDAFIREVRENGI